jgi:hypothetical protein
MPRPNKHNNLVDDNWGATEYADEYYDDEDWKEPDAKPLVAAAADPNAQPKAEPKAVVKTSEKPKAEPKPKAAAPVRAPTPPPFEEKEPILEVVDDWEAAMDALENHMSAQEEKKLAAATAAKK